ncbi:hypothetical protein BVX94_02235 [bacterium B17]|nr:hypothetical protein BVX94_02235 [bacterium B17]
MKIIEELLERLKPILGSERTRKYWLTYLAADRTERSRIEALLQIMAARELDLAPGSDSVYLAPPPQDIAGSGNFLIGDITCNRKVIGELQLTESDINQHTLVAGRSGSGKTTAVFRFLCSAHENDMRFLVLDWKNEYRSLVRHHKMGRDLRVFTVGKSEVSPLQFNPLIPPANTSPSSHLKHTIDLIQNAYFLGEGVAHILQLAIDSLYRKFRVYDGCAEQYPTFADVAGWLDDYKPKNQREAGWVSSTTRALGALCFGEMGKVVVTNDPLPMNELLARNTIIEMEVSAADKSFIVQSLLWNIYAHCAGRQEGNQSITNLVVLEEAHNILRKSAASAKETVVELLMRQARSRGIGIIVVDQTISLLSPSVLSNIHNLFCLSQPPSSVATKMMNLPEDGKDFLGRLEVGQAIGKLQSRYQAPFTVKFPLEPCKEQFVSDSDIRDHMRRYLADTADNQPIDNNPDISRPSLHSDEIEEKGRELLKSIWEQPYNGTVQKFKRIGVSRRKGQKIRQKLIQTGLIRKTPCIVPEGQIVLMEVTKTGRKILRQMGVDTSEYNPREGGAVHRYWVERTAQQYRDKGYTVAKEVPFGDRIIDVVAMSPDGNKVGVEIIRKGNTCDVVEENL